MDVGFPGGSDGKESTCKAGVLGLIPGLGRSPGEGNGCLKNSMDRGGWQATVHGATKSQTQLSDFHFRTLFFVFYSIMVYLRICNRVPRALQEGLVVYYSCILKFSFCEKIDFKK